MSCWTVIPCGLNPDWTMDLNQQTWAYHPEIMVCLIFFFAGVLCTVFYPLIFGDYQSHDMKNSIYKQPLRFGICNRAIGFWHCSHSALNSEIQRPSSANVAEDHLPMTDDRRWIVMGFSSARFDELQESQSSTQTAYCEVWIQNGILVWYYDVDICRAAVRPNM